MILNWRELKKSLRENIKLSDLKLLKSEEETPRKISLRCCNKQNSIKEILLEYCRGKIDIFVYFFFSWCRGVHALAEMISAECCSRFLSWITCSPMTFRPSDNGLNSSYKVDTLLCPVLIRSVRIQWCEQFCWLANGLVSYISTTLESCG